MDHKLGVLILEDLAADAELVELELRKAKYHFMTRRVETKQAFLKALKDFAPDLILSDYSMPQFDGMAAMRLAKKMVPSTPFIIVTGSINEETAVECIKAGAADYVIKEHLVRLVPAIESALEKKRTREEKEQAEEKLRKSEEKYRTLFEESQDAIFISAPDGKLLDINPAGVRLFGYATKEELLQLDLARDLYFNPQDRERFLQKLAQHGFVKNYELVLKRKNGEKVMVYEAATAIRDANGKIVAIRGIMRDMTEQKQLEEQLRQAQKMETIGTLAGGVAHDFNNLLTVILGNAEFGLQDSKPEDPVYQDFIRIERAATQARDLICQLLSFSRRQVLKPNLLNLNKTIEDLSKMLKRIIAENIKLKTELTAKLAPVWADPGQLQQVLMNLCVNARDAMPRGGQLILKSRNIEADNIRGLPSPLKKSGDFVQLTITDTGVGMDRATQARIFEPFFTTKEVGKGTGLGLSVVYGIVKQHGGHIEVTSETGGGTTFDLYFPAASQPAAFGQTVTQLELTLGGGETILLVEDDEAVRNVAVRILEMLGYSVLTAEDGMQAMTVFEQKAKDIDVVILDVVMPKVSGPDLYENLIAIQPNLPVIFATGYDVRTEIDELVGPAQAPVVVLQKPYNKDALGQKIREVLK